MDKVKLLKLPKRFVDKVDGSGECWLWTAHTINNGYGHYKYEGKLILAHRYSWIVFNGEIPKGVYVLHKCDVRNCVKPDHLFLGNHRDNAIDMFSKGRGFTPAGEKHGRAKLTREQVEEIRRLYVRGSNVRSEFSQKGLAIKYGVTPGHIHRIVNQQLWNAKELIV